MALEYLKVFGEIEEFVEPLDDAQRGRVFSAMMAYAFRGEKPQFERGSAESYIWPAIRNKIDGCETKVKQKRANGQRGGRPPMRENQEKANETENNLNEPNETEHKPNQTSNVHEHDHEHVHTQEQDQEEAEETITRVDTASTAAQDAPICASACPTEDLTGEIARYQLAETLIRRYGLPPLDTSRDAIISDLEQYGEERVRGALERAAMSDSRGGISLNFYRLKLRDTGQAVPRAAPAQPTTNNPFAILAAKCRAEEGRT